MKNFEEIFKNINYIYVNKGSTPFLNSISYDSRKVQKGDVFFSIFSYRDKGEGFIKGAILRGASCIVVDEDIILDEEVTLIKVENARRAMALACQNFYDNPQNKLKLIGITGTNGKTTSSYMMKEILENQGKKVGLIGTIANYIGKKKLTSINTTPEAKELMELFSQMVKEDIEYVVMEVSSHSLALDRVYGLNFEVSIFTNLTQDHLDFHKTFENYFSSKLKLFKRSKISIINRDSPYGIDVIKGIDGEYFTYSLINDSDALAKDIKITSRNSSFILKYGPLEKEVTISIPGKYNIENALGVALAALKMGICLEDVIEGLLKLTGVPGRCELISSKYPIDFDIILDYAHTPDGLVNILKTGKDITKGNLIVVFGCGGDRDKTKRPIMGNIGINYSDIAIITSDNPRSEDPREIINDIIFGLDEDKYIVVENRKDAIKKALEIAKKDDLIVIAGKGHEDYQILKTGKIHFDEREIVDVLLKEMF